MAKAKKKAEDIDDNKPVSAYATKSVADIEGSDELSAPTIENPDAVEDSPKVQGGSAAGGGSRIRSFLTNVNPYLILFAVIIVISIALLIILNRFALNQDEQRLDFEGTELTQESVSELLASETNVGTVDQTLTVGANAIFNGKILVKDDLDVAGSINVGGPLSLPGITVAGDSAFDNVQVDNSLSILGSATIQENLTIQQGLTVAGSLSVGGTLSAGVISADVFEFTGDLTISRHLDTSGGTPNAFSGTAVGGGGTVSISGNDIAGSVTIQTGSNPPAGILARMVFAIPYTSEPSVQITPVNSSSGSLDFYVDRTTTEFSIGTANAPSASTTYKFDYFISQ